MQAYFLHENYSNTKRKNFFHKLFYLIEKQVYDYANFLILLIMCLVKDGNRLYSIKENQLTNFYFLIEMNLGTMRFLYLFFQKFIW